MFSVLFILAIQKEEKLLEIDYTALGVKVKAIRNEKGMTQDELAEKCNLSSVYIGYVENAKRQIGLTALINIADSLNIGLDYLIGNHAFSLNDELLSDCTEFQKQIIFEIIKSVKEILSEKNL